MEEEEKVIPIENKTINPDETSEILNKVKTYEANNMYIITSEIDSNIPLILSYLQNDENEIQNKIQIIKYLHQLIKTIPYNLYLLLQKKSNNENQKMNLYEIIMDQFIYTESKETDYFKEMEEILSSIFIKLQYNKEVYRYIFSYLRNFLNVKYNNEKSEKNFNQYNYKKLLKLIILFYQHNEDKDYPINYFFFNGEEDTNIIINNKEDNHLNIEYSLYLLFFVKVIDYKYISCIKDKNNEPISSSNLLKIKFKDKDDIVNINIGYKLEKPSIDNFTINIPYNSFSVKESNYVFIDIGFNKSISIYVNNKKIEIPSNLFNNIKKDCHYFIESLNFFSGFFGLCSSIMIYKNSLDNKLSCFYPNFLVESRISDKKIIDNNIDKEYINGFFNEELLAPLEKAEKNLYLEENQFIGNKKQISKEDDIQNFIKYNLISLYVPTRTYVNSYIKTRIEGTTEISEIIREVILVDSINKHDIIMNNKDLYQNLSFSRNGGVHTLSGNFQDLSIDIGGMNHLLPLIEVMTDYNELLSNENFSDFMSLILYFINYEKLIGSEKDTKFFYHLSLFLERLPGEYFTDLSANINSILCTFMSIEKDNNILKVYIQEFFNNVCLNKNILFKYNYKDRTFIYKQIMQYLTLINNDMKIDIDNIINILLFYEKDKYTHFCCKKHSEYFNNSSKIMEPELNKNIEFIIQILKQILILSKDEEFVNNKILQIFELLTLDISPCMQIAIFDFFYDFYKGNKKIKKYMDQNINKVIVITLFVYKISLFDVKEMILDKLMEFMQIIDKKQNDFERYIEYYTTYFYYPLNEKEQKEKKNYKKKCTINNNIYILTELSENQKKILSNYKKEKFNKSMSIIFDKAKNFFVEQICTNTNLNILISLASKIDADKILLLLALIKGEFNNKDTDKESKYQIILNSKQLLFWLFETCYQAYLIKNSKINKIEFIPGFLFGELMKKDEIIDKIIEFSKTILIDLFSQQICYLDYLLTWSKYYNALKVGNEIFKTNRKFIFDYFLQPLIKINTMEVNHNILNRRIYIFNIIFEFLTFYRTESYSCGNNIKELDDIYLEISHPFIDKFSNVLQETSKEKIDEDNNQILLKDKLNDYYCVNELFDLLNIINDDKHHEKYKENYNNDLNIYEKLINGKKDIFINQLKVYFNDLNVPNNLCNQCTKLIILKYHYYTTLLSISTNLVDFKKILNELSSLLVVVIIASSTVTIHNKKDSNPRNSNIKTNDVWPTEKDYEHIQKIVKIVLFYFFSFLKQKIDDINKNLVRYSNNSNDAKSKEIYDNNNEIKKYYIITFFYFLKLLYTIHSEVKKEEEEKQKKVGAIKGFFNKIKNLITSDKEGIKKSGPYIFIEEFMDNFIIEEDNLDQTNSFTVLQKKLSFLDYIPSFTLDSINKNEEHNLNSLLEKYYKDNIENNKKIDKYFIKNKEEYQKEMFPFVKYIIDRDKKISTIIPYYDNSIYIKGEFEFLCLKPNYIPNLPNIPKNERDLLNYRQNIVDEIRRCEIRFDFIENEKIRKYRKIKKKLFSFNGILSTKKYFYDKKKYICKYRLFNHRTEDYTKIFLTPIIDIDYYLPKFSKFKIKNLFRAENKDHLIQIIKLADLSIKEKPNNEAKTKENNETSDFNGLYLIKESEFKGINELNKSLEGTLSHYQFFMNFIDKTHAGVKNNYHNSIMNVCLIKPSFHIRGFFYNNEKGIGFYSYDKLPYQVRKKSKSQTPPEKREKKIDEIQSDYDIERNSCFGSVFSPQSEKYEYYHLSIPYSKIIFILKRRYYFKVSAIEIFTADKKSYLFKMDHAKLEDVLTKIKFYLKSKPIYIEYKKHYQNIGFLNSDSIANNMNKIMYQNNYMNLSELYEKWKKWEISTMRLLMLINIYANRSFNDVNQYPVFPWIITDYKSDKLTESSLKQNLRPLDTPMGMLTINPLAEDRKKDYIEHWELSGGDEDSEDGYGRYGSHYSTSLYITYYLLRIFPFASIRLELQGTTFDDPNRLFNSLETSFDCASTQKADLRELIPELFCMPEILLNNNDFNLGEIRDLSIKTEEVYKNIQEVEAPKWSQNNAYTFIQKHRQILESSEVSYCLDEWINIIFGYKQKGIEAHKINNLFNSQTYEDYESIYDKLSPEEKEMAMRMFEFGATPNQIFKNAAPKRRVIEKKFKNRLYYNIIEDGKEGKNDKQLDFEEIKNNISNINASKIYYFKKDSQKKVYIMNHQLLYICRRKKENEDIQTDKKPESLSYLNNPYGEDDIQINDYESKKIKTLEKEEIKNITEYKFGINNENKQPIVWLDSGTIIVKGGYWNGAISLQCLTFGNAKNTNKNIKKNFIYSTKEYSLITKIVVDKNETFAICGNTNGTIYIFKIAQKEKYKWSLIKNFNNHNSPITSIGIHEDLNIAITCSQNGLCMLYSLPYFQLYNSFIIGKEDEDFKENDEIYSPDVVLISDSPLPCFIFYVDLQKCLYFYSINGHLLNKKILSFNITENTIKLYRDINFIDYLLIYNTRNYTFDLYTISDFILINRTKKQLSDVIFIDFILSEEMDHALVLCKNKEDNKYKIYSLNDSEIQYNWK